MISNDIYIFIQLDGEYVPAGILQQNPVGRGFSFRYGNKYIQRPNALAIDPISLPLSTEQFQSPQLFSVFRDASPDRWGRRLCKPPINCTFSKTNAVVPISWYHGIKLFFR